MHIFKYDISTCIQRKDDIYFSKCLFLELNSNQL